MRKFSDCNLPEDPNPWQFRVEELRREHRISLQDIANEIGIGKATFYTYLSKSNQPPPAKRYTKAVNKKLAILLKTSPDELWTLWQQSSLNSNKSVLAMEGIRSFVTNYPEKQIPKDLLIKLLGS
jgi:transcriptional regulator with XRE-family HTH domain